MFPDPDDNIIQLSDRIKELSYTRGINLNCLSNFKIIIQQLHQQGRNQELRSLQPERYLRPLLHHH